MRSTRPTSRRLDHTLVELPGQRSVGQLSMKTLAVRASSSCTMSWRRHRHSGWMCSCSQGQTPYGESPRTSPVASLRGQRSLPRGSYPVAGASTTRLDLSSILAGRRSLIDLSEGPAHLQNGSGDQAPFDVVPRRRVELGHAAGDLRKVHGLRSQLDSMTINPDLNDTMDICFLFWRSEFRVLMRHELIACLQDSSDEGALRPAGTSVRAVDSQIRRIVDIDEHTSSISPEIAGSPDATDPRRSASLRRQSLVQGAKCRQ